MKQNWMIAVSVLAAFTLGVVTMWAYQNKTPLSIAELNHEVFAPTQMAVVPRDPFEQMEMMRQQMDKMFGLAGPHNAFGNNTPSALSSLFDRNPGISSTGSLTVSEDDESVTYNLEVPKKDLVDLNVNIKDGYLSVDAKVKQESQGSFYQSQISQMLPLPADADPNSLNVESGEASVVIHLKKQPA